MMLLACLQGPSLVAQSGCLPRPGALYGIPGVDERGKSIVYLPADDLVLVFGTKGDSLSALYMDRAGVLRKVVNFMVIPGVGNHLAAACLDPDGMIGLAGHGGSYAQGGQVFACRFDPVAGKVTWARTFTSYTNINYCFTILLNPLTGNYILSNNPHIPNVNLDVELVELDRTTGVIQGGMTGHYDQAVNDHLGKIIFHEGYAYGIGRFSYSASQSEMRNGVIKLDPADGGVEWLRMGHVGRFDASRLYGVDLHMRGNDLFMFYHGDPSGSSVTNTYLYVQRYAMDGSVHWVKQYNLPGNTDTALEMVPEGEDYIILARSMQSGGTFFLIRIDPNGNVEWARQYRFPGLSVASTVDRGTSRLVMIGDSLWITGVSTSTAGDADMILLRTDLNGVPDNPCVTSEPISLGATDIANPMFILENPDHYQFALTSTTHIVNAVNASPDIRPECVTYAPAVHTVTMEVCRGQTYEGHAVSGIYRDTFSLSTGCDSIRILDLTILPPVVYVLDTSICTGAQFEGYANSGIYLDTFVDARGCDSIRQLMLSVVDLLRHDVVVSICAGSSLEGYAADGIYVDTFVTALGCDSIRTLHLTVLPPPVHVLDTTICNGNQVEGYLDSGIYVDTFTTSAGCDSIRRLVLSVVDYLRSDVSASVCAGDAFEGYGSDGIYIDTFVTMQGCDSIRTLTLSVIPVAVGEIDMTICAGSDYDGYSSPGMHVDTLVSALGCDSIRMLTLSVSPAPMVAIQLDACTAALSGFEQPGIYQDTITGADGCDTIRRIEVAGLMAALPNVFSPNQDGVNDLFVFDPSGGQPELQYARLFDRYGGQIYDQRQWPVTWDGRDSRGKMFQPGVYTLVIRYTCGGPDIVEKGTITLLR